MLSAMFWRWNCQHQLRPKLLGLMYKRKQAALLGRLSFGAFY